jgi:hypothetical protein
MGRRELLPSVGQVSWSARPTTCQYWDRQKQRRNAVRVFEVVGDDPHRVVVIAAVQRWRHSVDGHDTAALVADRVVVRSAVLVVKVAPVAGGVSVEATEQPLRAELTRCRPRIHSRSRSDARGSDLDHHRSTVLVSCR